ncbi:MAG TPA: hypothetical protein VFK41_06775 [Nocardioidaceae bacterium]|nr:hypothetical protein [Nocardioidaceae bacterium]
MVAEPVSSREGQDRLPQGGIVAAMQCPRRASTGGVPGCFDLLDCQLVQRVGIHSQAPSCPAIALWHRGLLHEGAFVLRVAGSAPGGHRHCHESRSWDDLSAPTATAEATAFDAAQGRLDLGEYKPGGVSQRRVDLAPYRIGRHVACLGQRGQLIETECSLFL